MEPVAEAPAPDDGHVSQDIVVSVPLVAVADRGAAVAVAQPRLRHPPPPIRTDAVPSVSLLQQRPKSAEQQLLKTCNVTFTKDDARHVCSGGTSGEVFVLPRRIVLKGHPVLAVKQQHIANPNSIHEKPYRECRILAQLNFLLNEYKCPNFVYLLDHFKGVAPLLFALKEGSRPLTDADQFMYFIMDYANQSLATAPRLDALTFRSMLFQLFYALHVAQKEFQFVHHDLHAKNILMQDLPAGKSHIVYHDKYVDEITFETHNLVWYTSSVVVKIVDFGLARLRLRGSGPEEIIYNVRDQFSEMFNASLDAEKVLAEMTNKRPAVCDDAFRRDWRSLVAMTRKGTALRVLLRHSFFAPLQARPEQVGASPDACDCYSTDGDVTFAVNAVHGYPVMESKPQRRNAFDDGNASPDSFADGVVLSPLLPRQPFTRQQRAPKREYVTWGAEDRKSHTGESDMALDMTGAVPWSKYVFADVRKDGTFKIPKSPHMPVVEAVREPSPPPEPYDPAVEYRLNMTSVERKKKDPVVAPHRAARFLIEEFERKEKKKRQRARGIVVVEPEEDRRVAPPRPKRESSRLRGAPMVEPWRAERHRMAAQAADEAAVAHGDVVVVDGTGQMDARRGSEGNDGDAMDVSADDEQPEEHVASAQMGALDVAPPPLELFGADLYDEDTPLAPPFPQ